MKFRNLYIIAAVISAACAAPEESKKPELKPGDAIVGMASPVRLEFDQSRIYLLDYFAFADSIDSVSFNSNVDFEFFSDSGVVVVNGYSGPPVGLMTVRYGAKKYDIPIFRSKKQSYVFTYSPEGEQPNEVGIKGNFNGWNHKANLLSFADGAWRDTLVLNPGLYEYLIVEDGEEMLDSTNPNKKDNGQGGFNSTFTVGSVNPRPHISTFSFSKDSIFIHYPEDLLEPLVLYENHQISDIYRRGDRLAFAIPAAANDASRSHIRVFGCDEVNRSNDLLIPMAAGVPVTDGGQITRADKQSMSMYFMMVDRFENGNLLNDQKVDDPDILPMANYFGGDLEGVLKKVQDGYFEQLGTNTIWLSPIVQNPLGAYGLWDKGGVETQFSGYHGYWPISSSKIDFRFGNDSVLMALIEEAHGADMNVILDYVANHVHQEHPVYQNHPDWATDLYLPDGSLNTERWDEYRLTTWFDTFLPTLDLERTDVTSAMTDSALYWFEKFPIDGFRHDATKHIPLNFWRELTRKLKYRVVVPENRNIYQVGETYGNPDLIGSYISTGMLDAQFDFNLYDACVSALAKEDGSLTEIERVFSQSLEAYGDHHLMGNISGNQDRTRFISYADGTVDFGEDPKLAGWTRDITRGDSSGFDRLALLQAFNFFVPGVPVIYYGDEIGIIGAGDPDNRRMMRFGDALLPEEEALLNTVSKLAHLRQDKLSLLYGDTKLMQVNDREMVLLRNYFDESSILFLNSSREERTISVEVPVQFSIEGLDAVFGKTPVIDSRNITITLPPLSFEILTN